MCQGATWFSQAHIGVTETLTECFASVCLFFSIRKKKRPSILGPMAPSTLIPVLLSIAFIPVHGTHKYLYWVEDKANRIFRAVQPREC